MYFSLSNTATNSESELGEVTKDSYTKENLWFPSIQISLLMLYLLQAIYRYFTESHFGMTWNGSNYC